MGQERGRSGVDLERLCRTVLTVDDEAQKVKAIRAVPMVGEIAPKCSLRFRQILEGTKHFAW